MLPLQAYVSRLQGVVLIEDHVAVHLPKVEADEAWVILILVLIDQVVVLEHRVGNLQGFPNSLVGPSEFLTPGSFWRQFAEVSPGL